MKHLTKQTLNIFFKYSMRYKLTVFFMFAALFGSVGASVYLPILFKNLIDLISTGNKTLMPELFKYLMWIVVAHLFVNVCYRSAGFMNAFFQPRVMSDILQTCFNKLHQHSYRFFSNNFTGSLVRRVNRFERSFEDIADQIYWHLSSSVLRVSLILIILFTRHWVFGVATLFWVVIFTSLNYFFAKLMFKYDLRYAEIDSQVTGRLADTITNNVNIKFFGGIKKEQNVYNRLTEKLFRFRQFSWNVHELGNAVQGLLMVLLQFLILYFAIKYWQRDLLTVGDFVLIQMFVFSIFDQVWDLGRYIQRIFIALAEAEEMTEILLADPEVGDVEGAKTLLVSKGKIEFKNITFAYRDGGRIFKRFNLAIKAGEKIALVGPSGGGKSTVTKLLFRFFDLQGGKIEIDGQDISKVTLESLQKNVSLVPQDPILFHRSLLENIKYARPNATKKEIMEAAKLSHAHNFISKFPKGYDTHVGERGIKLSGGERQRVAIARAILKNAPILVLDEATSSLDSESEAMIQDALKTLMKGRTTIVIAHRLSTIMQMDRIYVIENGQIIEEGKHDELVKAKQGMYQRLWEIQAGGFV